MNSIEVLPTPHYCAKVASSTYSDIRSALVGLKTPY